VPKPHINIQRAMDVKCLATKRHYGELLERYSYPITCINLTKKDKERELIVSDQYKYVINEVLNKELPKHLQINYVHLDWKKFKKEDDFVNTLHK
jgi:hypothetical protein